MLIDPKLTRRRLKASAAWEFTRLAYLFAAGLTCVAEAQERSTDSFAAPTAVIDRYCADCHNRDETTAGLAFDMLDATDRPPIWKCRKSRLETPSSADAS